MRDKFYAIFSAALVAFSFSDASALENCKKLLPRSEFESAGGRLIVVAGPDLSKLPYNFFCDFVPCGGNVSIAAMVRENGSVKIIGVDHNDWNADPLVHASTLAERVAKMRFAPPRVAGKPVCVRFDETFKSDQYKAPRMIKHWP
ncbi:MAG TPA: hypothetical protein VHW02_10710 [Rhizomicrobium sp.]|jgi:hypothetical protein|nr:hypothetical protein [Rhizomicrobium sp.]